MSRTKSAAQFPKQWRLEAWMCQMDFADGDETYTPEWSRVLHGMPFWARQLLAVMISMHIIQVLMDDDSTAHEKPLVQKQLDMWRTQSNTS